LQFLGTATSFDSPKLRDELQRTGIIGVIIGMLERYYIQDKESMKNFSISPLSIDEYRFEINFTIEHCMSTYVFGIVAGGLWFRSLRI